VSHSLPMVAGRSHSYEKRPNDYQGYRKGRSPDRSLDPVRALGEPCRQAWHV
jgi:hypothetical protein